MTKHSTLTPVELLEQINAILEERHSDEKFNVAELAQALALSRSQLHRKIKAVTGKSVSVLLKEFRLKKARHLLQSGTPRMITNSGLVDDEEIHYPVATDEFEKVIEGVNKISGLDALVITVEGLDPNLNVVTDFQEFYAIYLDLVSYVETNYTDNASRTLIGRGSAANFVLGTLYLEEQETAVFQNFIATTSPGLGYFNEIMNKGDFPLEKDNKKLHFSLDGESNYELNMRFINTLNEKAYPWLEFDWAEYPNLMFTTSYPSAFADGIKYIFED